ncbi:MAG: YgjV family protein, partial [Bacilli bacterium]|nr:YgjV family protein [Bacilli bacterium]
MNLSLFIKIFDFSGYTPYDWVAQIIGFIGAAFFVTSMVQKKKISMIIFQFLALTFLFVNLLMIHAIAGAIMDGLGAIRMA